MGARGRRPPSEGSDTGKPADVRLPHPPPANDPPDWRTMESVAKERGFETTRSMRDWCRSRRVLYKRDGKYLWVDHNAVLAAIAGLGPTCPRRRPRRPPR